MIALQNGVLSFGGGKGAEAHQSGDRAAIATRQAGCQTRTQAALAGYVERLKFVCCFIGTVAICVSMNENLRTIQCRPLRTRARL